MTEITSSRAYRDGGSGVLISIFSAWLVYYIIALCLLFLLFGAVFSFATRVDFELSQTLLALDKYIVICRNKNRSISDRQRQRQHKFFEISFNYAAYHMTDSYIYSAFIHFVINPHFKTIDFSLQFSFIFHFCVAIQWLFALYVSHLYAKKSNYSKIYWFYSVWRDKTLVIYWWSIILSCFVS